MPAKTALVLGAGHDGLAAAVRLARAGLAVTVLERRDQAGGVAAVEPFHEGWSVPGIRHGSAGLRERVVRELALAGHGLALADGPPRTLAPEPDGPGLVFRPGSDALPEGLSDRSHADASAWLEWRRELAPARKVLDALFDAPPPEVRGAGLDTLLALAKPGFAFRTLGADRIGRLLRAAPMCAEDLLADLFEDRLLRAFLATRGMESALLGPRSAGSGALLLVRELAHGPGARGGPAAVTEALVAALAAEGGQLETGRDVAVIAVREGRVVGVETADGRSYETDLVVSALGVKRTLALARGALPVRLRRTVDRVRARGTTAAVRLALDAPLRFRGREDERIALARVATSTLELERAFDRAKHREWPDPTWLDVYAASVERPRLAPEGAESVSVLVHNAAFDLEGGWSPERADALGDTVVARLAEVTTGLEESIVARAVLTPPAVAERYRLDGGHPAQAEMGLDQLWIQRPSVHLARYRTEVGGLFLAGRSSHPGGEFGGATGLLAAEAALAAD